MNKQTIKILFLLFTIAVLSLTCAGGKKGVSSGGKGGGGDGSEGNEFDMQDSDGDGFSDYEETQWKTDPEDPDDFPLGAENTEYTDDPALPNLDEMFGDDLNTPGGQDLLEYLQMIASGTGTVIGLAGLINHEESVDICFEPDTPGNAINGDEIELQGTPFTGNLGSTLTFKGDRFSFTSAEAGLPSSGTYYILGQNIAMAREPFPGCIEVFSLKVTSETCTCGSTPACELLFAPPKTESYITAFTLSGTNIKSLKQYSDSFIRTPTIPCTLCESESGRVQKADGTCMSK